MYRPPARRFLLAAAIVLALSGCGSAALPPSASVISVRMTEYRFMAPSSAAAGRTIFHVVNGGRIEHSLTLEKLPGDFPPINVQLHSKVRRGAPAVAIMPPLCPGGRNTFAVDLTPGRYAILSAVVGRDGVVDALKGMAAEIRVRQR